MNVSTVPIETKFLRLRQPVPWGQKIDGWSVCWLGGRDKCRMFFIVMVMKTPTRTKKKARLRRRASASHSDPARIRRLSERPDIFGGSTSFDHVPQCAGGRRRV